LLRWVVIRWRAESIVDACLMFKIFTEDGMFQILR
jgi:hypothetical protein